MRQERGQVAGNAIIYEPFELWGSVGGDVKVIKGGKFYHRGTIYGNLVVEDGGRCHIFGNITGDVTIMDGAKVIHSGVIGGNVCNRGGRFHIDDIATIMGKVKTISGITTGKANSYPPR